MTKKKSKIEKLLTNMKSVGGMNHEEIVKFLLRGTGKKYGPVTRKYFDSTLYGNANRVGVLEGFCWRRRDGVWKVKGRTKIQGPFNPRRPTNSSKTYADGWSYASTPIEEPSEFNSDTFGWYGQN